MAHKIEPETLERLRDLVDDALKFERDARVTISEVKRFLNEDGGGGKAQDHNHTTHNSTQNHLSQVAYNSSQSSSDQANSNVGGITTASSLDMPRGMSVSSLSNISKALSTRYPITKQYSRFMSTPRYPLKNTK